MGEVVLRLQEITKNFGTFKANENVNLDLAKGEVLALLGENGAGKTTLMNILFGQYIADSGRVEVFGNTLPPGVPRAALDAGVGMVHQHFALVHNLSVIENVVLGTRSFWSWTPMYDQAREQLLELANRYHLKINPDAKVSALSIGERQRVEILKALFRQAKILILDEPTAVLTPQETETLFITLKRATAQGLSIIFISHKLHEVMRVAHRVAILHHGRLLATKKTAETNPDELAALMVGNPIAPLKVIGREPGPPVMEFLDVSTESQNHSKGLQNVSMILRTGEIVGLAGVSGNGQTTIADLVAGLIKPSQGTLHLDGKPILRWSPRQSILSGVARIPEDRHHVGTVADFSLTENSIIEQYRDPPFAHHGWVNWKVAESFTQELITQYDVRCPGPDTKIRLLSGGNMQKLILGRALHNNPRVILAHQPSRGLDIGAVHFIHNKLLEARQQGAAILLISEDLDEILQLSDIIYVSSEGRVSPAFKRGHVSPVQLGRWMSGAAFAKQEAVRAS
jgi:simple sugar transport system ATP-binding protein